MTNQIQDLINRNALFVVNHSAGKDSQAMLITLRDKYQIPDSQLLIIHADLGKVEWQGNLVHIKVNSYGLPIIKAKARRELLQMVRERGMFPSPSQRQCTSDLKRGPIEREIRRYLKAHPEYNGLIVNCMGMRAQESSSRAKKNPFTFNKRNSKASREWYDWLPIHEIETSEVFQIIEDAGQKPHWAYSLGMSRLSCRFCIMASQADLTLSAKLNPDLYREYVELEREIGHTMSMSQKTLPEITGIQIKTN